MEESAQNAITDIESMKMDGACNASQLKVDITIAHKHVLLIVLSVILELRVYQKQF